MLEVVHRYCQVKVKLEYLRRVKLVTNLNLYGGDLMRAINAWAIDVVRYSVPGMFDWSDLELRVMDVKMRKRR